MEKRNNMYVVSTSVDVILSSSYLGINCNCIGEAMKYFTLHTDHNSLFYVCNFFLTFLIICRTATYGINCIKDKCISSFCLCAIFL